MEGPGLAESFYGVDPLRDQDVVRLEEIERGDAEGGDASLREEGVALRVRGPAVLVLLAVDLDAHLGGWDIEIEEVGSDGDLAADAEAEFISSDGGPKALLAHAHVLAQFAGALGASGSWHGGRASWGEYGFEVPSLSIPLPLPLAGERKRELLPLVP